MTKRHALTVAAAMAAMWPGHALAADNSFSAGTIAIGGERLSGFFHTSASGAVSAAVGTSVNGDVNFNHLALLGTVPIVVPEIPRIGIDGFVIDGLSLGGTLGVDYNSVSTPSATGPGGLTIPSNSVGVTSFLVAPRVGYALMFADSVGIWPRGGIAYYHQSSSPDQGFGSSTHYVSLVLEAPFIFALTNGFAITAGPLLDVSLSGSTSSDAPGSPSVDTSYTTFGVSVGLLGWL